MIKRVTTALLIAGLLAGAAGSAALAAQGHGRTAGLGSKGAGRVMAGALAGGRHGGRFGRIGLRGQMAALRVTGVSGSTINATTFISTPVTVTVSSTTVYTQAGVAATLADVHPGATISVRGQRSGAGTIQAAAVVIVLPRVTGVVTSINGSTIMLTGRNARSTTVLVTSSTRFHRAGQAAALTAISTGTVIVAEGTANSDGSLTALSIQVILPRVAGRVTAVNGSTLTLAGIWGASKTVLTSASTTYTTMPGNTATASAVVVGSRIVAEGTLSADGKTLTATRIYIMPARQAGRGIRPGYGFGPAPRAGLVPSTSGSIGSI